MMLTFDMFYLILCSETVKKLQSRSITDRQPQHQMLSLNLKS